MAVALWDRLNPIDVEKVAHEYQSVEPTHFFSIDDFLRADFARELARCFPGWEEARAQGTEFRRINERVKVQITDSARFPEPIARLHELLASPEWLTTLSRLTGIPNLIADPTLAGGGMHVMGAGGRLGVHVDFNMLEESRLHRRLNILVYLTPDWKPAWDGSFEIWDPDVTRCIAKFTPDFNRCLVFNTTQESFHGVCEIRAPDGVTRNSFAAYYYTVEPPAHFDGSFHNTIYKPRPGEWWKGFVQMPLERFQRTVLRRVWRVLGAPFRRLR